MEKKIKLMFILYVEIYVHHLKKIFISDRLLPVSKFNKDAELVLVAIFLSRLYGKILTNILNMYGVT